jgi:hypothetical protein
LFFSDGKKEEMIEKLKVKLRYRLAVIWSKIGD